MRSLIWNEGNKQISVLKQHLWECEQLVVAEPSSTDGSCQPRHSRLLFCTGSTAGLFGGSRRTIKMSPTHSWCTTVGALHYHRSCFSGVRSALNVIDFPEDINPETCVTSGTGNAWTNTVEIPVGPEGTKATRHTGSQGSEAAQPQRRTF